MRPELFKDQKMIQQKKTFRDFDQCQKEIYQLLMVLILHNSDEQMLNFLKILYESNEILKLPKSVDENTSKTLMTLHEYKLKSGMNDFVSGIITQLFIEFTIFFSKNPIITEQSESSNKNNLMLYVISELLLGAQENLYGTYHTFRHPVETAGNLWIAIRHPITTVLAVQNSIRERPIRYAGNVMTGWLVGKIFSAGVQRATQKLPKSKKLAQDAAQAQQAFKEAEEKLKGTQITINAAKFPEQIKEFRHAYNNALHERWAYVQAGNPIGIAQADAKISEITAAWGTKLTSAEGLVSNSAKTIDELVAGLNKLPEKPLRGLLGTRQQMSIVEKSAREEYLKAGKIAQEAAERAKNAAIELKTIPQSITTIQGHDQRISSWKRVQQEFATKRKEFYERILKKWLLTYLEDYMFERLSSPESWSEKLINNLPHPKNLIFEGGGPKGIVYVGALEALIQAGIDFNKIERVGGTSAGAITALLISVGYSIEEIKALLGKLNLSEFLDDDLLRKDLFTLLDKQKQGMTHLELLQSYLPLAESQQYASNKLRCYKGLFSGEKLRQWLEDRVVEKMSQYTHLFPTSKEAKMATFGDLVKLQKKGYPVKALAVVGSDISTASPCARFFSAEDEPDVLIVDAVRVSLSIPLIFYPHQIYIRKNNQRIPHPDRHLYMDGGCFVNYPVSIYDRACYLNKKNPAAKCHPNQPIYNDETLGFRIEANLALYEAFLQSHKIPERAMDINDKQEDLLVSWLNKLNPFKDFSALVKSLLNVNDHLQLTHAITFGSQQLSHIANETTWKRTIYISPGHVSTLDFNLTYEEQAQLIRNGHIAVGAFLARTMFDGRKSTYQSNNQTFFPPLKKNRSILIAGHIKNTNSIQSKL